MNQGDQATISPMGCWSVIRITCLPNNRSGTGYGSARLRHWISVPVLVTLSGTLDGTAGRHGRRCVIVGRRGSPERKGTCLGTVTVLES